MWTLKKVNGDATFYLLPEKTEYTVGRTGVDFVLKDDASISRTHATIRIVNGNLELEDPSSKYGTFVNSGVTANKRIDKNGKVTLQLKDLVRFGLMQNIWRVEQFKIASLASALKNEEAKELVELLRKLGGKFISAISEECTHLTMNTSTVTLKLLHALVYELPIVRLDYWKALIAALSSSSQNLPKPEMYQPRASDLCRDVKPRPERKTLFNGFTFVFMNRKQFQMYGGIIMKIGGVCKDLNTGVQKGFLIKPKVVVIQYIPSTQSQSSQTISSIADLLKQHKKRLVPEYEIGLAIVSCSVEKYCNPNEEIIDNLLPEASENETPTKTDTLFVENSASSEEARINSKDEDFVVAETDQSISKNSGAKPSAEIDTIMENNSAKATFSQKRSRTLQYTSDDSEDEAMEVEEENESKRPRREFKKPQEKQSENTASSSTRSLRSRNSESSKKEVVAIVTKVKPKRGVQSITIESSGDEEMKEEVATVTKVKPKRGVQSITIESSGDEEMNEELVEKGKTKASLNHVSSKEETAKEKCSKKSKDDKPPSPVQTHKRGFSHLNVESSDEEDGGLFNFSKKPNTEETNNNHPDKEDSDNPYNSPPSKRGPSTRLTTPAKTNVLKSPQKPSPRPLPITTKTKTKTSTRTVTGFLEKSQKPSTSRDSQPPKTSEEPQNSKEPQRKRTIISVIRSDDEDDDLFNFVGDDSKKKPRLDKKYQSDNDDDEEDDDLFAFKNNKNKETDGASSDVDEFDLADTQQLGPDKQSTQKSTLSSIPSSMVVMPKPKALPAKVNISGWLSCPGIKQEMKEEGDLVKEEPGEGELDEKTVAKQEWLDSIKGGFEVRFCNLNISSAPSEDQRNRANGSNNSSNGNLNSTVRNFKAFVKKRNLCPQTTVIKLTERG